MLYYNYEVANMYKTSEEVFEKLKTGEVKIQTVTRNMNKHLHKRNIEQWMLFAKAKALYKMWELDGKEN